MNASDLNSILRPSERAELSLRALYQKSGFRRFKMSKFEEYDFYSDKKDFLTSPLVLSFTDTSGRLMALKPDVTLSIVKNTSDAKGLVDRIFYSENVYRPLPGTDGFKEIRQTGVECIGDLGEGDVLDIIRMARESLSLISDDFRLNISHQAIVSELLRMAGLKGPQKNEALRLLSSKNAFSLKKLIGKERGSIADLLLLTGDLSYVIDKLEDAGVDAGALKKLGDLNGINIDFSLVNDLSYYQGFVMQGYIPSVSQAILSGGEYDPLLKKMGRNSRGAGFCVYTDFLENDKGEGSFDPDSSVLNIALPKGRLGESVLKAFKDAGYLSRGDTGHERRLVLLDKEKGIRVFWVKPSDVHIYVERGVADIGVVGRDILLEYKPDVYELMDLGIGSCFIAEAALTGYADDKERTKRVATKFEKIARDYYASLGRDIDIIRLNGSIELSPILGLSDVIVDIVETGTTLRENNLSVTKKIADISARLIAGKSSYEFKRKKIEEILFALEKRL